MDRKEKKLNLILLIIFILFFNQSYCLSSYHQQFYRNQVNHSSKQISKEQKGQNCTTSYSRLFFTQSQEKMLIKFNTRDPCSHSYVTIIQNNIGTKFNCDSQMLRVEQKTVFIRYIQTCLVTIQTEHSQFRYVVHGHSNKNLKTSASKTKAKKYKVNIPHADEDFNLIVVGDWGPLRIQGYQPIHPSLVREINNSSRPVHGLFLLGDLAYDLSTNQCQQYQIFMSQLQMVSPYLPIIAQYGNHEFNLTSDIQIFKKTFQVYNMNSITRVQSYQFWNLKIVTFNPYQQIIQNFFQNKTNGQNYTIMKNAILQELKLNKSVTHFTLLSSHYPFACSQILDHCNYTMWAMEDTFIQISNLNEVDLYLAGHKHQYQRIAPYKNGTFSIGLQGPYGKGSMISIIEAAAGNDQKLIQQQYKARDFSMKHTFNQTGYGLLKISNISNSPSAEYYHYITLSENETILFDQVSIDTAIKN